MSNNNIHITATQRMNNNNNSKPRPSTAHPLSSRIGTDTTNSRESLTSQISPRITKSHITSFTFVPLATTTITSKHYNIDQAEQLMQLQQQQQQQLQMLQLQEQCKRKVELVQQQQQQYKKVLQQNKQHIEQLRHKDQHQQLHQHQLQQHQLKQRQQKLLELDRKQKLLNEQYNEQKKHREHLEEQLKRSGQRITSFYPHEYFNKKLNKFNRTDDPMNHLPTIVDKNDPTVSFGDVDDDEIITVPPPPSYTSHQQTDDGDVEDGDRMDADANSGGLHLSNNDDNQKVSNTISADSKQIKSIDDRTAGALEECKTTKTTSSDKIKQSISTQTSHDDADKNLQNFSDKQNFDSNSPQTLDGNDGERRRNETQTCENRELFSNLPPQALSHDGMKWFPDTPLSLTDDNSKQAPTKIKKPLLENKQTQADDNSDESAPEEATIPSEIDENQIENKNSVHGQTRTDSKTKNFDVGSTPKLQRIRKKIEICNIDTDEASVERSNMERSDVERSDVERSDVERLNVERSDVERSTMERSNSVKHVVDAKPPTPTRPSTIKQQSNNSSSFRLPTPELKIQYTSKDNAGNVQKLQNKEEQETPDATNVSPTSSFHPSFPATNSATCPAISSTTATTTDIKTSGKFFKGFSSPWSLKKNKEKKDQSSKSSSLTADETTPDPQKLSNSQHLLSFLNVRSSPTFVKKFSKILDLDKKLNLSGKRTRKKSADLLGEAPTLATKAASTTATTSTATTQRSSSMQLRNKSSPEFGQQQANNKEEQELNPSDATPNSTLQPAKNTSSKNSNSRPAQIVALEMETSAGIRQVKPYIYTPSSLNCSRSGSPDRSATPKFPKHQRQNSEGCLLSSNNIFSFPEFTESAESHQLQKPFFVIVAIDFGTTYSGYAFSFVKDPESLHIMRKWEGGDPGLVNQKTLSSLLLNPDGEFHSFGFTARDNYHDLDQSQAKKWFYFEKFKMALHHNSELNKNTTINASNGQAYPALKVFVHSLKYFKDHALQELTDQSETSILNDDIRWVITVPAIWKAPAKQFMRQAAYMAGLASPNYPGQLLIALEPEAASIYVRKLRTYQLIPETFANNNNNNIDNNINIINNINNTDNINNININNNINNTDNINNNSNTLSSSISGGEKGNQLHDDYMKRRQMTTFARCLTVAPTSTTNTVGQEVDVDGTRYMVVDCGGGTVDITVHEMEENGGCLRELHRATGGPYGSIGIDHEFEKLLCSIFSPEFVNSFKLKRPTGWVDLMTSFEARKRSAHPNKCTPLNVALPFSFIEYYKKFKGSQVEGAIKKHGGKDITWSSQGMLRLNPDVMRRLFAPTLDKIKQSIGDVLNNQSVRGIRYIFLVGGFAESGLLQFELKKDFGHLLKIIIPQDVSTTILKGAVCFGLDPTVVSVRKCRLTYGVGVLNRFVPGVHPEANVVVKDGVRWCRDVLDKFVVVDQPVALGDTVVRSYAPAKIGQRTCVVHIYCTERPDALLVSDQGVRRCGTLCLDLSEDLYRQHPSGMPYHKSRRSREIQTTMIFGDTEIKVSAVDVHTGKCVRSVIDFLGR